MLPEHGKITCRECFTNTDSDTFTPNSKWKMINDPGAWGGREPEYLVLGFSKGATQSGMYDKGRFEDVAFAGMRNRLTQALRLMTVLSQNESVDEKISDSNSNIAFGSLIRCSVSRIDEKASASKGKDIFACTGPLITKSFSEIPEIISACSRKYLSSLPATVRIVFMLGNGDSYVKNCQRLLESLFPGDFRLINAMAVYADGRLWVHLAHPSGLNGHFNNWANESVGPGLKRIEASSAICRL